MGNRGRARGEPVLVVEGTPGEDAATLVSLVAAHGCAVTVTPAERAAERAAEGGFVLAILQPGPDGSARLDHLRRLQDQVADLRVAVLGPRGDVRAAVEALRAHAFEFVETPAAPEAIAAVLDRARRLPPPGQASLLESLQILTPGLVHELRNPLSGILAGSQMLARLVGGQGAASEYAGIIREEAQHLERFLARLAEFGRLRAVGLHCAETVDLAEVLASALDAIRATCAAQQIRIVTSVHQRIPALRGDPGRLSQAFAEILRNAQEAMPDGGTLTVGTRLAGADADPSPATVGWQRHWAEIEFSDTGPGMTAEAWRRGCEPFFSTRPRALGVGLSLAQAIALAHGGMLCLEGPGRPGGHVVMRLPVASGTRVAARRSRTAAA
jgi:signal transduction histidine kinase